MPPPWFSRHLLPHSDEAIEHLRADGTEDERMRLVSPASAQPKTITAPSPL